MIPGTVEIARRWPRDGDNFVTRSEGQGCQVEFQEKQRRGVCSIQRSVPKMRSTPKLLAAPVLADTAFLLLSLREPTDSCI